ncbi:unnamed protein product [Psylliodes chrysocephalus]|uniref:MORN repeat-containing protein 5 n=1 Tax=Psylliodes chrysocephalus TaxID=3402493 RepID=A0A9P0GAI3_9CUCU|nr:unnamed protein product [Psylliodes chrysocephala]
MESFLVNTQAVSRISTKEDIPIEVLHKKITAGLNNYCRFLTKTPKFSTKTTNHWNYDGPQIFSANSASIEKLPNYYSPMFNGPRITIDIVKQSQTIPSKVSLSNVSNYMGYESNKKNVKCFFDGTCYAGEWNALGFAGKGIYKYPHGVIYDGQFNQNGQFHGHGTLIYPNGHRIEGTWDKGKLSEDVVYSNKPDTHTEEHRLPDRRYPLEVDTHLGAPGAEHVTSEYPAKPLADGCFDVGDGVYIKSKSCTMHHQSLGKKVTIKTPVCASDEEAYSPLYDAVVDDESLRLLDSLKCKPEHCFFLNECIDMATLAAGEADIKDIPDSKKEEWIKKYCRSGADNAIGFAPELYEVFTTGAKEELEEIQNRRIRNTYYVEDLLEKSDEYIANTPMMFAVQYPEKPKLGRRKTVSEDNKLAKKLSVKPKKG